MNTLSEYLSRELKARDWSQRELADRANISHRTVDKILDPKKPHVPKPDILLKIASVLGINPVTLMGIAYPEYAPAIRQFVGIAPDALLRSQRIEQLPENVRDIIDTLIFERAGLGKSDDKV